MTTEELNLALGIAPYIMAIAVLAGVVKVSGDTKRALNQEVRLAHILSMRDKFEEISTCLFSQNILLQRLQGEVDKHLKNLHEKEVRPDVPTQEKLHKLRIEGVSLHTPRAVTLTEFYGNVPLPDFEEITLQEKMRQYQDWISDLNQYYNDIFTHLAGAGPITYSPPETSMQINKELTGILEIVRATAIQITGGGFLKI